MKLTKYMLLAALPMLVQGCKEDPVLPPINAYEPNTSLTELKETYWQSDANYVSTIGKNANGEDIIIKGRVISSDETGNIYKSMMISDGNMALTVAANVYDIWQTFTFGQEVVINVTGLCIGGYNGLMQLGGEGTYNNAPSMTFMSSDDFASHIQGVGRPDPAAVDTIATDLAELANAKSTADGLMAWQSQLVRIDGVTFENAGDQFAPSGNTNRYVKDANGNRLNIRCSSYSDFAKDKIPAGSGSVTGILSYYGNDWQMLLIDLKGLQGFESAGTPDAPDAPGADAGTKDHPLDADQVAALGNPGTSAWVKGYIVGVMNYVEGTGNVFSASELTTNSNVVIAAKAADYGTTYVPVQLPAGDLRTALNLVDHPENLGKELLIQGSLEKYCGMPGLKACTAAVFNGAEIGSEAKPDQPGQGGSFTLASSVESGATYALWTADKVSLNITANYGYIKVADCKPEGNAISATDSNAFVFTRTDKGWTIRQAGDNRYLYMTGTFNSFNLDATLASSDDGFYWTVTPGGDGVEIKNVATGKTVQFDSQYSSYGAYSDMRGTLPKLYKK